MRTIIMIKDNILVQQDKPKEKLESGLFIPQTAREAHDNIGTVIAIGPGRTLENGEVIPVGVVVGERVLFKRRPASALEGEWEGLLILKDEDILAVVEDKPKQACEHNKTDYAPHMCTPCYDGNTTGSVS